MSFKKMLIFGLSFAAVYLLIFGIMKLISMAAADFFLIVI